MRVAHEPVTSELVDMELIELKFIFDRRKWTSITVTSSVVAQMVLVHFDNRDFDILPNYQPRGQPSFHEQTILFGKPPGVSHTAKANMNRADERRRPSATMVVALLEDIHQNLPASK